jgi:hypothetical protein
MNMDAAPPDVLEEQRPGCTRQLYSNQTNNQGLIVVTYLYQQSVAFSYCDNVGGEPYFPLLVGRKLLKGLRLGPIVWRPFLISIGV